MIAIFEAFVLAIVQGITEWLPVSSSGHLALIENIFGIADPVFYSVMLHFATLFVVIVVFWKDVVRILKSYFIGDTEYQKLGLLVLLSVLPTAAIGFAFMKYFEAAYTNYFTIAAAFFVTAILLMFFRFATEKRKKVCVVDALVVGVAQGIAIIPGISRSGATIATGRFLGLRREIAAKFAFLMFIPAIIGATGYQMIYRSEEIAYATTDWGALILAMITAAVVGYFALKFVLRTIKRNAFHKFSYYCFAVGVVSLILGLAL
ncbi:undecaprenyl-diphosphatase [Candidatus Woesearchaeota archaeon]|nr:MAG: undecaprenyl-diphosphatase [Candidatus Woesearchaeota archaeon]